jgi:hypothetical protein
MPSHRWGKLNRGQSYGFLADDWALRLSTVRLRDHERVLLEYIRVNTWSRATRRKGKREPFPDPSPFIEDMGTVADRIGLGHLSDPELRKLRKRLYEARRSLLDIGVLREAVVPPTGRHGPRKGLAINTNCDEWLVDDREVLPRGVAVPYARTLQNSYPPDQVDGEGRHETVEAADLLDGITEPAGQVAPDGQPGCAGRTNCPPQTDKLSAGDGLATIGTRASEDLILDKEEKSPLPPNGGTEVGEVPVSDPGPTFRSDMEAEVYRMAFAVYGPGDGATLSMSLVTQFRARVKEGFAAPDIHAAFLKAKLAQPERPDIWPKFVATYLRRVKEANPPPPPPGPTPAFTPEYMAKIKALRDQQFKYERRDGT